MFKFKKTIKIILSCFGIENRHLAFPIFRSNIYSQNGEDGVIEFILNKVPLIPRFIIDIGASDGIEFSNSRLLIEKYQFNGLLIEPNEPTFAKLEELYKDHSGIALSKMAVGEKTTQEGTINWHGHFQNQKTTITEVNEVLTKFNTPKEIGFFSIDTDGSDNEILSAIDWNRFCPFFVIAEIDSSSDKNLQKQINIMDSAGYFPVLHIGNVFYVRKDLAGQYFFNWKIELPGRQGFFKKHTTRS